MKDIFVVEGKNDVIKLHRIKPNAYYIMTNGSEISDQTINEIKSLSVDNNIILLLDPDGPGEKIRRKITDNVENVINVFVPKKYAISHNKKKVGIEHVDDVILNEYLKDFHNKIGQSDVDASFLLVMGLIGKKDSKGRRYRICEYFNIGYANAKTFIYKCNLFGINKADIIKIKDIFI